MNANVAPRRLGHAYSVHGIGGNLGYAAALGLGAILLYSLFAVRLPSPETILYAFGKMYALDGLALFFKRFFLLLFPSPAPCTQFQYLTKSNNYKSCL